MSRPRRRGRGAAVALLALLTLLPAAARAQQGQTLEYQLQLQSSVMYCNHWFSGHDPGNALDPNSVENADLLRRKILLPPVVLWRNTLGGSLHKETRHTQWDLSYTFGYDYFVEQQTTIVTDATATDPAVLKTKWDGWSRLNSYENRLDGIGRLELSETTYLILVERVLQSRFNLFSVPAAAQTMPRSVSDFDISGLTFLGNTTRAMLEKRFAKVWETRPELDFEAFKIFGHVPPELGSVLGSRALVTLRNTVFRHFSRDVLEATAALQYVAVSTPPDIPANPPSQPDPISQGEFGRDYMVMSAALGWAHRFTSWFNVHGRIGYATHMYASHQAGDAKPYHGPIGGLRLHVHDDNWNVVLEYTREFDTSIWGASVIYEDVGVLEFRRRLGEHFILWADLSINRRNVREPDSEPGSPTQGQIRNFPQYITYNTVAGTVRFSNQLSLDIVLTYRKQWGPGVALPYDKWIPGVMLTLLWPERSVPPMRTGEAIRRLTREPFEEERRSDRERDDDERRERLRRQPVPDPGSLDTGGVPLRRRQVPNAPSDWGGRPQPQPRPEGAPPPPPEAQEEQPQQQPGPQPPKKKKKAPPPEQPPR
ncbi:MAG: hypothetical protein HY906_26825 [Deltaproteobacteria bacterium]|nr:hypothetical protein [Deltaproteobacteria bacterium]